MEMRAANPRFVLKQWVLEEVIRKVESDPGTGKRVLAKVLQVSSIQLIDAICEAHKSCPHTDGMSPIRALGT